MLSELILILNVIEKAWEISSKQFKCPIFNLEKLKMRKSCAGTNKIVIVQLCCIKIVSDIKQKSYL